MAVCSPLLTTLGSIAGGGDSGGVSHEAAVEF